MTDDILYSGGADGSDLYWAELAAKNGHTVIHYGFAQHKSKAKNQKILTQAELEQADPYLITSNKSLKRTFPTGSLYTNNLLRRNWWLMKDSDTIYAVSPVDLLVKDSCGVIGGTAWAVQCMVDKMESTGMLECYLYDPHRREWLSWSGIDWKQIDKPPRPEGHWTGIGTRQLTDDAKEQMDLLF